MSAAYRHPDGHEINIARCMLTVTNDADESVSVPIGQTGLRELGERLIVLSSCEFTAADCAEQAGNTIATAMLNDLLRADNQAEISKALTRALHDLFRLPYEARATAGFAVGLVNVLEIGLQNLPKGASK